MQRMRDLGTLSPEQDISIKSLPARFKKPRGRGERKSIRARGDGHQEDRVLWVNMTKAHMSTQRLAQHAGGLLRSVQVLSICILVSNLVILWGSSVWTSGSLFLVTSLGLFSFCLLVSSNSDVLVFVLSYFILFHYILLLPLRSLFFFPNERQKVSRSWKEGRWEGAGRSGRKKACNQNRLYEGKITYFQ